MTSVPTNLAQLLIDRAARHPDLRIGAVGDARRLPDLVAGAARAARGLGDLAAPGACAMVVGTTSTAYLGTWAALQLSGIQAALVNPTYPTDLLRQMATDLGPDLVVTLGEDRHREVAPDVPHVEADELLEGALVVDGDRRRLGDEAPVGPELPGLAASPDAIASYMHTSGTTGVPKFCAQSHEYFLRLGRFIADTMCYSPADTVFAPLPMFHINPLGYGVVASLVAGAHVLGWDRFSASAFWPTVRSEGATVLILHVPPGAILKKATTAEDAAGHRVRIAFTGDPVFLEQFDIAQGVSGYGSTEAGGLCHAWMWRQGDRPADLPEGLTHKVGRARHDVAWRLGPDGEILVRAATGLPLFSGYRRGGSIDPCLDDEGWFHTGDLGRLDEWGGLVFVERMSESIRVKGEFVPIDYVEARLRDLPGLDDLAIWQRAAELADQEVVLYVVGGPVPVDEIKAACADLPAFMRPVEILRVDALPRDAGVGKVQRRRLADAPVLEAIRP